MRADEIRQARKRQRLTQADLAAKVGVSRVTVGEWEAGRQVPTPANLAEIARALHEGSAGPPQPQAPAPPDSPGAITDPSYWAGYLAAASQTLAHAHAMIGDANTQIAHMLANREVWQAAAARARGQEALDVVDAVDAAVAQASTRAAGAPPAPAAASTPRRAGGRR